MGFGVQGGKGPPTLDLAVHFLKCGAVGQAQVNGDAFQFVGVGFGVERRKGSLTLIPLVGPVHRLTDALGDLSTIGVGDRDIAQTLVAVAGVSEQPVSRGLQMTVIPLHRAALSIRNPLGDLLAVLLSDNDVAAVTLVAVEGVADQPVGRGFQREVIGPLIADAVAYHHRVDLAGVVGSHDHRFVVGVRLGAAINLGLQRGDVHRRREHTVAVSVVDDNVAFLPGYSHGASQPRIYGVAQWN